MQALPISPMDSLTEEHSAMTALLALIKTEQKQLLEADIAGLNQLTENKTKVVVQISDLAGKRHRALAVAGFAAKEDGMQAWLESAAGTNSSKTWIELLELTKTAKELNRINGILINKLIHNNQKALSVLHATPQGGNFYGPNGQSANKPVTRRLVIG